ncbi:hypothetical protein Ahy_A09g045611 isoform B [Arachis hypogaea]|uniref:Uncharacterized protein n=1 Tax=Arachis hypogaea TaxID=3818 RepID=A0A445BMR8_ARAHY|nr:hypothetical protein Ahy_A09g045611 isoform B [Arachis hypogaea]
MTGDRFTVDGLTVYYEWYIEQYGMHLRLSDRVAGEEVPAQDHYFKAPAYDQQFQMPAYDQQHQMPTYDQYFQMPVYDQQHQMPAFEQPFQMPAYEPQFQMSVYEQQFQMPTFDQQYLVVPPGEQFSPLVPTDSLSLSQVLRDTDTAHLFPTREQKTPAPTVQSAGRRASSGHASDFDVDTSTGHIQHVGPSAPPRTQLFDLSECLQEEEDVLRDDDLGGASAPGLTGSWICDTGSSSMTDFGGLDAGVSQGHPYNLRTQTAPPDKYTPSLYLKKAPRK